MPEEKKEELKKMVAHLAHAINHTLSNSPVVRQAVEAIHQNGYGLDLSLSACIGISKKEENHSPQDTCQEEIKFEFDQQDLKFLKALNLRLTED